MAKKRKLAACPFLSPSKRYKKTREHVNVEDFDTEAIGRTVHLFYDSREYLTLDKLLQVLKENRCFKGGRYCCSKY